jgi:hypothetical protein
MKNHPNTQPSVQYASEIVARRTRRQRATAVLLAAVGIATGVITGLEGGPNPSTASKSVTESIRVPNPAKDVANAKRANAQAEIRHQAQELNDVRSRAKATALKAGRTVLEDMAEDSGVSQYAQNFVGEGQPAVTAKPETFVTFQRDPATDSQAIRIMQMNSPDSDGNGYRQTTAFYDTNPALTKKLEGTMSERPLTVSDFQSALAQPTSLTVSELTIQIPDTQDEYGLSIDASNDMEEGVTLTTSGVDPASVTNVNVDNFSQANALVDSYAKTAADLHRYYQQANS